MRLLAAWWLAVASAAWGQGLWESRAPYPLRATEVSAAVIGDLIYAMCGLTATGSTSAVFVYDPRTDAWRDAAPLPAAGDHCNVAAVEGRLYMLGALSALGDGTTYEYDPQLNRWQAVGRMGTPRGASGVAAIGSKIYVAGGLAGGRSVADFAAFDPATRTWERLPNMPVELDHLTAQAVDGKFYAIAGRAGGIDAGREPTAEYDPPSRTWRLRAPIPVPRGGLGSGVIAGRIIVFGGEGQSGRPERTYAENHEYDPATDSWRPLARMDSPARPLRGQPRWAGVHAVGRSHCRSFLLRRS